MVYDLLTELDKQRIDNYREEFAYTYGHGPAASLDHILAPWNNAKSKLEKLFGNQLIIKRNVEFKEDIYEIEEHMKEILDYDLRIQRFQKAICDIYRDRVNNAGYNVQWWDPVKRQQRFVCDLFGYHTLANNKADINAYTDDDEKAFTLKLADSTLIIQNGMRPIRIITKIANAFNIGTTPDENGVSDLEYFRRRHSLGLNQKLLKGELCLSIHPLDYMTMSDNDEGWDSCMSWVNEGEYKQGTVEMMNSPCVVVAYLSSGPNRFKWGFGEDKSWNSKKWRSLFVVDEEFIINIKSYPYDNDNLVKATIQELARLAGWQETKIHRYKYLEDYTNHRYSRTPVVLDGREVALDFCSGAMYNDFGRTKHYIALNPNSTKDLIDYSYYYSGDAECMWCGDTDPTVIGPEQGEGCLQCYNCYPNYRCECCGDRYDGNDYYVTADGAKICSSCWEYDTGNDFITKETYLLENLERLYLSTSKDKFEYDGAEYIYFYEPNLEDADLKHLFKIDELRKSKGEYDYQEYYVLVSDCTPEGLKLFELYDEDDIKDYLGVSEDN